MPENLRPAQLQVAATSFLALFSIVGLALYGLPFYYDLMVTEHGWTREQVTSGNAYSKLIVGPLFGFLAGWLIDRFGPRRLMLAGILMAGFALIGLSAATTLSLFYFFYLFNALGNVCGGPLPNQVLLSRWFTTSRGKAMGFAYLGIGIGGAIVQLLSSWLINAYGWQESLRIIGVLIIVIALPAAYFVKESPGEVSGHSPPPALPPPPIAHVFRSLSFYLLLIGSMCSIGAVGGANQNLKLYLSLDQNYSQADAAWVIFWILIFSIFGRLLAGWLADRFPKKYVMLLIYVLITLSLPLLFFASSPSLIYLFVVLFGIGLGGEYMIIPLMAAELFGVRVLGRLMGVVLTADGIAEALSPKFVASLRDAGGSYRPGFAFLIGLALVGALAVALLPRQGSHSTA